MLNVDDPTWTTLTGGRGSVTDVRPLLRRLEVESDPDDVWKGLWDALHHQVDIGIAAFAAVPHLVRIHRQRGAVDWNAGELPLAKASEAVLSILSVAAIVCGQRARGRALLEFEDEGLQDVLDSYEAG